MKLLSFLILLNCSLIVEGQEPYIFEKIDLKEIQQIELIHQAILIDTVKFGITLKNFSGERIKTKTLIYKRVNDEFQPKLHVWYHLDSITNEVLAITYNWDFYNPSFNPDKNRELILSTSKREIEYKQKYESLNQTLKDLFGKPIRSKLLNDSEYSFNEITYWENKDIYAYTRMRFQRTIDESPFIGLANNHFVVQMVISYK